MDTTINLSPSAVHSQTALLEAQHSQKQEAFQSFLDGLPIQTLKGLSLGLFFGVLLCGQHKISKFGAFGAGIGGGMALNQCAIDFNKI